MCIRDRYYYRIRAFKQQGSGFTYGAFSPVKSIKIELLEATDTFRNYTGYTSAKAAIDSFAAKIGGMSTYYNQNGYDYVRGGKEMIFATAKNAKVSSGVYNISIYNTGYDNLVLYGACLLYTSVSDLWRQWRPSFSEISLSDARRQLSIRSIRKETLKFQNRLRGFYVPQFCQTH